MSEKCSSWLFKNYPDIYEEWVVDLRELKLRNAEKIAKQFEAVQRFLDRDTDTSQSAMASKKIMQFYVDEFKLDSAKGDNLWGATLSIGKTLPNYPHHRIGKEEEE